MDTLLISTNEIEDPVSHIARTLRPWFPLTGVIHITYLRPICVMVVANAVVASVAPAIASLFSIFAILANFQDTGN